MAAAKDSPENVCAPTCRAGVRSASAAVCHCWHRRLTPCSQGPIGALSQSGRGGLSQKYVRDAVVVPERPLPLPRPGDPSAAPARPGWRAGWPWPGRPAPRAARRRRRTGGRPGRRPGRPRASRDSRSPKASWRGMLSAATRPSTRTPTSRIRARWRPRPSKSWRAVVVDLPADVGRLAQRARPGDRGEVGEPHLDRDGAARWSPERSRAAVRSASRSSSRRMTAGSSTSGPKVSSAPMLLSGSCGHDRSLVAAPGQRVQVLARPPARAPAPGCAAGVWAMSPTVRSPSRLQHLLGLLPHAPQRADRQRVQELDHPVGRDDQQAVGLAPGRGELGHELGRGHPDRGGDALLVGDAAAQQLGDLGRPAEPADGSADVEERLVEGERLDQRGDRPEDLHQPAEASA